MKVSLLILGLTLIGSGCVSKKVYKEDIANAIRTERERCASNNIEKDNRLKRFNQLNPDGSLR